MWNTFIRRVALDMLILATITLLLLVAGTIGALLAHL